MAELPSGLLNISTTLPARLRQAGMVESTEPFVHDHDQRDSEHKLLFVREGELQIVVDSELFHLHTDQCIVILPNEINHVSHKKSDKLKFYFVYFSLKRGRSITDTITLDRVCDVKRPDRLTSFFRLILDDKLSDNADSLTTRLLLVQLLAETAKSGPPEDSNMANANNLMDRGKAYIRRCYMDPLTTAGIAKELEVSAGYFGRSFCKAAGYNVTEFISMTRIYQARKMLTDTNLSIKQIARDCGFEDAAYFSRAFRKREGMSPRAYKRLHGRYFAH